MYKFIHESDEHEFKSIYRGPVNKVKMEVHSDSTLNDLLESFTFFLKGCGFYMNGELEFIEESEKESLDDIYNEVEELKEQRTELKAEIKALEEKKQEIN